MKFILLGILYLYHSIVTIEAALTRKDQSVARIIGGDSANIEDYPWQISMRWDYGVPQTFHFCGGSIISKQHILTAAHCVDKKRDPATLKKIKVYTGSSRSNEGEAHRIRSVTVHPGYKGPSNFHHNDIAIVTLVDPIEFNSKQKPINLPTKDVDNEATVTLTGWGDTEAVKGETPIQLQKATMKLLVSNQCKQQLPYNLQSTQVCVTTRSGYGMCSGDSGGPLVENETIVGIASYVAACGSGKPEVFTNVYSFVDFIKKTINTREVSPQEENTSEKEDVTDQFNNFGNTDFTGQFNNFGNTDFMGQFNNFGNTDFTQQFNNFGNKDFTQQFGHFGNKEFSQQFTNFGNQDFKGQFNKFGNHHSTHQFNKFENNYLPQQLNAFNNKYLPQKFNTFGSKSFGFLK